MPAQRPLIVESPAIPPANGHYAQAVRHGDLIFVSGQLGRGPGMSDDEAGDIAIQARRCLQRIADILKAAESDLSLVIKTTTYVPDVALWPAVDAAYREVFGTHKPARAVVPTSELHFGALVEIDAIAAASCATQLQPNTSTEPAYQAAENSIGCTASRSTDCRASQRSY